MLHRRHFGAGAIMLASPLVVRAQTAPPWPQSDRSVEVIVLAPPGGPVDAMTRIIMPFVAERIPGMRPVITNRAGAGGQIGLEATFNAAPDGYTLGATTMPAQMAIPIERPTRFRAMDFTFIANIVEDPNALYVHAESPFHSLAGMIERARTAPGTISCATTGIGSDDHLFLLAFEAAARIPPLTHVPFSGNAPLFSQLLGGHLDLAAVNINDAIALKREGKVRALAAAAAQRSRFAPDVPDHARTRLRRRCRCLTWHSRPTRHASGDRGQARGGIPRRAKGSLFYCRIRPIIPAAAAPGWRRIQAYGPERGENGARSMAGAALARAVTP